MEMIDGLPRAYDDWRTTNAEDEEDIREARRLREEAMAERADDMRDRDRDEPTTWTDWGDENQ